MDGCGLSVTTSGLVLAEWEHGPDVERGALGEVSRNFPDAAPLIFDTSFPQLLTV